MCGGEIKTKAQKFKKKKRKSKDWERKRRREVLADDAKCRYKQ